jgi:hypothetical protein
LVVATSPDFAHFLLFFLPMASHNTLPTGLATVLAPLAATLFLLLAIVALHRSVGQLLEATPNRLALTVSARLVGQRIVIQTINVSVLHYYRVSCRDRLGAGAILYVVGAAILLLVIVVNVVLTGSRHLCCSCFSLCECDGS